MLGYSNVSIFYKTMFSLVQHHKYSLTELENLMIFERDIYVDMLVGYLEEQKEQSR